MSAPTGEEVLALAEKYIEVIPDDADPNGIVGFRKDVSMALMREHEAAGMAAYVLLHYFIWREQVWCRKCGCQVLAAWMVDHWNDLHRARFGF